MLEERTVGGLHDFVITEVLRRLVCPGERAIDLGAGSGALALRLHALGWIVQAADINADGYKADLPFARVDLNHPDFAAVLGERMFHLVTAVEVIEHVESPIGFLRNVARLLRPGGIALLTTPNVDNIAARIKFLLAGKLRMLDELGDPTHISPIFWDLLVRQYLPRAGLELTEHFLYPSSGFKVTRTQFRFALRALAWILPGDCLQGDNHVLVLKLR